MAYTDFTLDAVTKILGISVEPADLFPSIDPAPIPVWLRDSLERGRRQALVSEKARSEFLVVPILLATQEFRNPLAIYSGQRLDVDPQQGLVGECDFILAATAPLPSLRSPLLTVVEASRNTPCNLGNSVAAGCTARGQPGLMAASGTADQATGNSVVEVAASLTRAGASVAGTL